MDPAGRWTTWILTGGLATRGLLTLSGVEINAAEATSPQASLVVR